MGPQVILTEITKRQRAARGAQGFHAGANLTQPAL